MLNAAYTAASAKPLFPAKSHGQTFWTMLGRLSGATLLARDGEHFVRLSFSREPAGGKDRVCYIAEFGIIGVRSVTAGRGVATLEQARLWDVRAAAVQLVGYAIFAGFRFDKEPACTFLDECESRFAETTQLPPQRSHL